MRLLTTPRALCAAAALICGVSVQAQTAPATPAHPATTQAATTNPATSRLPMSMSGEQYTAAKDRIQADYKAAKAACDKMSGNAKDICTEEAKGAEKVADAELQYKRSGKQSDAAKLATVKAEAAYEVAKERCDDQKGDAKDACVKDAKATEARAKADAKAMHKG